MTTGARLLVDCPLARGMTTAFGVPGENSIDSLRDGLTRLAANGLETDVAARTGGALELVMDTGRLTLRQKCAAALGA